MADREDDSPTPVTLPGKRREVTPANGVPEVVEFETTDQMVGEFLKVAAGTEHLVDLFVKKLQEHGSPVGGGSEGGDAGAKYVKEIKRHKWIAALMAMIVGPGGAIAVVVATSDRSKANSQEVIHLKEADKALTPKVQRNTEDIRLIKVDVSGINKSIGEVNDSQTAIAAGIEDLKKENVNRLQKELDNANRQLRRLERNR
jgi:hypothetical protein